jgi:hypothetical protein
MLLNWVITTPLKQGAPEKAAELFSTVMCTINMGLIAPAEMVTGRLKVVFAPGAVLLLLPNVIGQGIAVFVGVFVTVLVAVWVGVFVTVVVAVFVAVLVAVWVAVLVAVLVFVFVAVSVFVLVAVLVAVSVTVLVIVKVQVTVAVLVKV